MPDSMHTLLQQDNWVRQNSGPLYLQLSQHIENAITEGRLQAGDPLPSERDIGALADISRVTVRKAVGKLVQDGLVVQKHGSGTSVAPQSERVQQSLSTLTSFSEDMGRRGMKVRSTWLEKGQFPPSPQETMALALSPDSLVSRVSRLRIADDMPLAIERASLSPEFLPDPDLVEHSLYALLDKNGNKPERAIQRISAKNLSVEDAQLLQVPEGSASLHIERISYLKSGRGVEFTRSVYRGDAYDFVAELKIGTDENKGTKRER